ncbi:MAG: mhpD [Sphingomonas bacterium]|nr:mhpD [Sphingomonas bacterium]
MASHDDLALRLREAYAGPPVPPLRDGLDPTDAVGAYAVQRRNTGHWVSEGRRIVGRKIGLTAVAVQVQLGVDQPDYGVLFDDMALADGGELDMRWMLQPKAEAEVALVLASDLDDPEADRAAILVAVDHVAAAIEIVDSRIADWKITFADTVADNGSSAAFVLSEEKRAISGLDLWSCGMVLEKNGKVASLGAGAACLGHPLEAAAWLARTLAAAGEPLRAGDIVLTGALGPMVPIAAGDTIRATIGGLGTCTFSCRP